MAALRSLPCGHPVLTAEERLGLRRLISARVAELYPYDPELERAEGKRRWRNGIGRRTFWKNTPAKPAPESGFDVATITAALEAIR